MNISDEVDGKVWMQNDHGVCGWHELVSKSTPINTPPNKEGDNNPPENGVVELPTPQNDNKQYGLTNKSYTTADNDRNDDDNERTE